jgi:hypothetical protein
MFCSNRIGLMRQYAKVFTRGKGKTEFRNFLRLQKDQDNSAALRETGLTGVPASSTLRVSKAVWNIRFHTAGMLISTSKKFVHIKQSTVGG